jgi:TonB family protein
MIVLEFIVFVVSSGLFCSNRFRGNITVVIIAGMLATGSSLLFLYDLGLKASGHAGPPTVQIVKQVVRIPVLQQISQPPSLSAPQDCHDRYPFWSRLWGQEGTTSLVFNVLADGTVNDVKVAQSSGSERLDDAAVGCVKRWHYRPAIKDGKLADVPWKADVTWSLSDTADKSDKEKNGAPTNQTNAKSATDTAKN